MFLGFNTVNMASSRTRLGFPNTVRIFPGNTQFPVEFDASVNVAARVEYLKSLVESYNAKGMSVFFSEKPKPADVLSGALDDYFIALAMAMRELAVKYNFVNYYTAWHEPENDVKTSAHPNNPIDDLEQFADMLNHIHHMVHLVIDDELEVGPVYMAYQWEDGTKGEYKVTNPASAIPLNRDFIGADVYSDLYMKLKTKLSDHSGWLKILANAGDSPVFIVERGIKDAAQQSASLLADFQYLLGLDNYVIGMLYWDNTGQAGDWRLGAAGAEVWRSFNYSM